MPVMLAVPGLLTGREQNPQTSNPQGNTAVRGMDSEAEWLRWNPAWDLRRPLDAIPLIFKVREERSPTLGTWGSLGTQIWKQWAQYLVPSKVSDRQGSIDGLFRDAEKQIIILIVTIHFMVCKDLTTRSYFAVLTIPERAQLSIPPPCKVGSPG